MIDWKVSRRAVLAGMAAAPFVPGFARAAGVGGVTRIDPALDAIVDANAPIEVLSTGFQWAEGPVWVKNGDYLLFSDVPKNVIWKWDGKATTKFLEPSGLAGPIPKGVREAGANGLAIDAMGRLIMADSGTRCVAAVDLKTKKKTILADKYDGKRFSSCNDVAIHSNGTIYFTDPPYGFTDGDTSPLKEQPFNGVYRLAPDGEVHLIENRLTRPNGVTLSPDQQWLYVTISDPARPEILKYPLDIEGGASDEPTVFAEMRADVAAKKPGLPDGIKVAKNGTVFSSGPGGIHVYTPGGKLLGVISTGKACANCAFGEDGKTLFLTSSDMIAKVRLKIGGW
ncbi:SMP-30/gluconolactonase/LRE family protein [Sphingomonas sp. LB-2]|uniref:SMP-30/gluconolactonase/LRE family protein n=1 Tax=Sphingomonas caeni TaxID=2984949 RepID=UPI00222E661F|nr:SMP-30/gluconolactonase/LRE family protein [Sphingomonas caeni]MCW3845958.1 SMP-30/gluconolactonase/LRE family protein [Sphingomonas caeni]